MEAGSPSLLNLFANVWTGGLRSSPRCERGQIVGLKHRLLKALAFCLLFFNSDHQRFRNSHDSAADTQSLRAVSYDMGHAAFGEGDSSLKWAHSQ